ncbi:MAG: cobalamin-binding protein [Desulfobacteraceae bacterium]|nr:cobalamin-binding protein [Desulfobacteraceae bacterium]
MKTFLSYLAISLCVILQALAPSATAGDREFHTVTDHLGRSLNVPKSSKRIVALAPSITEIVFALKKENLLVGATKFSDYPIEAKKLPKVGSYVHLDVERIVSLRPDLCIGVKDGNPLSAVEQLNRLNIPVFAVNPCDLESIMESIRVIGNLLGADEQATRIVTQINQRIKKVVRLTARSEKKPRVFFQIGLSPIVSVGSNTFIDQLISLAGGINVTAGSKPYPRFSREQIIALSPDIMVICSMAGDTAMEKIKAQWSQWPEIPAVRDNAVFFAPPDIFSRPSPRLVDGLELLAHYIHTQIQEVKP